MSSTVASALGAPNKFAHAAFHQCSVELGNLARHRGSSSVGSGSFPVARYSSSASLTVSSLSSSHFARWTNAASTQRRAPRTLPGESLITSTFATNFSLRRYPASASAAMALGYVSNAYHSSGSSGSLILVGSPPVFAIRFAPMKKKYHAGLWVPLPPEYRTAGLPDG